MTITAAMAAALATLTESLDDPDTDIAHSLQLLTVYAAAAVESFLGLSVVVPHSVPNFTVTVPDHGDFAGDIRTSLHLSLPGPGGPRKSPPAAVIFYAGSPGAFVDLTADLAWLTSQPLTEFTLDQHLGIPPGPDTTVELHMASDINQALGVLIGRGFTPQQAHRELDVQAAANRTDRHTAARHILTRITTADDDAPFDLH
ncbi:MAG: hypothetical protein ABI253_06020 [Mycobacterium sp.]